MADITKCANSNKCPNRKYCYRNLAKDSILQSYANFYEKGKICDLFIEVKESDYVKRVSRR